MVVETGLMPVVGCLVVYVIFYGRPSGWSAICQIIKWMYVRSAMHSGSASLMGMTRAARQARTCECMLGYAIVARLERAPTPVPRHAGRCLGGSCMTQCRTRGSAHGAAGGYGTRRSGRRGRR